MRIQLREHQTEAGFQRREQFQDTLVTWSTKNPPDIGRMSGVLKCLFLGNFFLIANIVTTSKALVTSSDALVSSSFFFLQFHWVRFMAKPWMHPRYLITDSRLKEISVRQTSYQRVRVKAEGKRKKKEELQEDITHK